VRVTLIHNPYSGAAGRPADAVARLLRDAGHEVQDGDTLHLRQALQDPGELVVAAGGDGTVRGVALALALAARPRCDVPMAIIPMGTANNTARSLGIRGSPAEVIGSWRTGARRALDLGVVRGAGGEEHFLEAIGGGVIASLVREGKREIDDNPHIPADEEIRHALALLARLAREEAPRRYGLEVDGRDLSGEFVLVEVMNIALAGPYVPLAPGADAGDGLLDVVRVTRAEVSRLTAYVEQRLTSGDAPPPALDVRRGRVVRLVLPDAPLRFDDEPWDARAVAGEEGVVDVALDQGVVEVLAPG
jgi:diacylglycerol kinase family enzyme